MPWEVKDKVRLRYEFVKRALCGEKILALCREYKISRPTGYEWLGRYKSEESILSLQDRSKRPHTSPSKTDIEVEELVCKLRQKYGWGGKKLRVLLERKGIELPVVTINRIIARNGLLVREDCHIPAPNRFERALPNELWQVDFKGPMGRNSAKCEPLSVLDDHSRFIIGAVPVRTKQTEEIKRVFAKIFTKYGVPDSILLDHGVPWWSNANIQGLSKFSVWLMKQNLKLIFSGIGHPQTQGKVERFHRSLNLAVWNKGTPTQFSEWNTLLATIVNEYNFIRPHEALNMKVPADCYKKSNKLFNPKPKQFEYGSDSTVLKVDSHGSVTLRGKRLFASHALEGEYVKIEELNNNIIISYRNSMIREANLASRKSVAIG